MNEDDEDVFPIENSGILQLVIRSFPGVKALF